MAALNPKEFIAQVFVLELGMIVPAHPYVAFMVMSIGLEFLGKCLDSTSNDWNRPSQSSTKTFESAFKKLSSLNKYGPYLQQYKLYDSLRCGLAHSASPKYKITLSRVGELSHLEVTSGTFGNRLNLQCEAFYADFKLACEEVINMTFSPTDKMDSGFLWIPGANLNQTTNIQTGVNESFNR